MHMLPPEFAYSSACVPVKTNEADQKDPVHSSRFAQCKLRREVMRMRCARTIRGGAAHLELDVVALGLHDAHALVAQDAVLPHGGHLAAVQVAVAA